MIILSLLSAFTIFGDFFSTSVGAGAPLGTESRRGPGQPADVEDGVDKGVTAAAPEYANDWSDVPLEADFGENLDWGSTVGNAKGEGVQADTRFAGASPEGLLYPPERAPYSDISEELGDSIRLEGEVPASEEKKKDSAMEQAKRFAAEFVLATPSKKELVLIGKDTLTGKELEIVEKKKKKKKKRREKLEFERLKRQQRKKYDSTVELLEQKVSQKRRNLKALRKILRYLQKLSEGTG